MALMENTANIKSMMPRQPMIRKTGIRDIRLVPEVTEAESREQTKKKTRQQMYEKQPG